MDVKSTFLNEIFNENLYIEYSAKFVKRGQENKVYKLKRVLYGLKQTPRVWYTKIDSYFLTRGFQKCPNEHTLYIKSFFRGDILIICLYVDDLILTGNNL